MQNRKASALFAAASLLATAPVFPAHAEDTKSDIRTAFPIGAKTPYGYVVTIGPNEKSDGTVIQTIDYTEHSMLTCRFSDNGQTNVFASYRTRGFTAEVGATRYFQNARQNILNRVGNDQRTKKLLASALGDSDYKAEVRFTPSAPQNDVGSAYKITINYAEQPTNKCENMAKEAHERVQKMAADPKLTGTEPK